ncbi:homoserine kinase [Enemella sp. A6]|uniref:homoserine kinase n=1 Tax=Enemella sp. A6 TaxID=3440152 RepID=UPI003EBEF8A4
MTDPRRVRVAVSASSANLGPGYDSFGLGLDWVDHVDLIAADRFGAEVTGEGADEVPTDERHLIIDTARIAARSLGTELPGLMVRTHNTIPHGRGLGSSSAAVLGGILGAWGLLRGSEPLDRQWAFRVGTEIEGHPDNIAAALFGGFTLAWSEDGTPHVVQGRVHADLLARVWVPAFEVPTTKARQVLPATVPHAEAAANSGRAGLLVHAIAGEPVLLHTATRDWLHQNYRAPLMPQAAELLDQLRAEGLAAVVSGAGPTLLALGLPEQLGEASPCEGWQVHDLRIGTGSHIIEVG